MRESLVETFTPETNVTNEIKEMRSPPDETDQLPMIVWLTGQESWAEEFSISADEAMNALSIKRSRLTQISGKELRVGRIRIDRYIRPVYRQDDITSYLNWSRATATHKSSSKILEKAVEQLKDQGQQLHDKVQNLGANLSDQVLERLTNEISQVIIDNQEHQVKKVKNTIEQNIIKTTSNILPQLAQKLKNTFKPVEFELSIIDKLIKQLSHQGEQIENKTEKVRQWTGKWDSMGSILIDEIRSIGRSNLESVTALQKVKDEILQEIRRRDHHTMNQITDDIKSITIKINEIEETIIRNRTDDNQKARPKPRKAISQQKIRSITKQKRRAQEKRTEYHQ